MSASDPALEVTSRQSAHCLTPMVADSERTDACPIRVPLGQANRLDLGGTLDPPSHLSDTPTNSFTFTASASSRSASLGMGAAAAPDLRQGVLV